MYIDTVNREVKKMAAKKKTTHTSAKKDDHLKASLTYVFGWITGLVFILVEKKDSFIRFHAAQSIVVFGGIFIINLLVPYIPVLGGLLHALLGILSIVLWILLIVKAYQGEKYKLPYIGDLAEDLLKKIG
jgi:uncharacterized membrane protein